EARVAVSGPTRIDLNETAANWRTDWTVAVDPRGPHKFRFELDAGLELIDVTGPDVDEFQAEATGSGTRATVTLDDDATGATPVLIRALARVPAEGPWAVPAVRPLDALWMGGTTTVRLDPGRVLENCRERAGRRASARPGGAFDASLLVFEAGAPKSVAELVFRAPWADVSVEVRGQLLLGNAAPRLVFQVGWKAHRGRLLALDVDLPAAWVPDRIQVEGTDETIAWHPETRPDGGARVHVLPPSGDLARRSLVLNVAATATIAGGRGPLALPRVRPVGVRVADELWLAWTEPNLALQPTLARGLAWIDPRLAARPMGRAPTGLREALAWRWTADDAEGRVDRQRIEIEPSGAVSLTATVDRGRLRLDGRVAVQAGGAAITTIPLGANEPIDPAEWRFHDAATGLDLPRRALDGRQRVAHGFAESGPAWELVLPHPRRGRLILHARLERPWGGRGRIPLLVLPERYQARGTVLVVVDRSVRSAVEAPGLRALEPAVAARTIAAEGVDDRTESAPSTHRRAHAFGYTGAGGRLELRTEDLEPARPGGVIREAVLTTFAPLQGTSRHHLTLRVASDRAATLDLTLPPGAIPMRVRRDGQAVAPSQAGGTLSIALPGPRPARLHCTIVLDYVTPHAPASGTATLRPERPETSLPCLSFCWEVVAFMPWAVTECGPGLVAADPLPRRPWPLGPLGAWRTEWGPSRSSASPTAREAAMLHALDERVVATRPEEVALGEWFTRWDSGPWPVVIDRMALAFAGLGPKSRVVPPRLEATRAGAARGALQPLGLTVIPIGGALLVTTRAEAPDRPGGPLRDRDARAAWEEILRGASVDGSDPSDRFQSVARWRGATTSKGPVLAESMDCEPLAERRRIWRFAASGWPGAEASVRLVDERDRAAWGWTAGLAVVLAGLACRSASRRARGGGLAVALGLATLATGVAPPRSAAIVAGAAAGGLAVLFLWLGQALPGVGLRRVLAPLVGSSVRRRARGSGSAAIVLAGLAVLGPSARPTWAQAQAAGSGPILALFPYEGPPRPTELPDRVLLRLADFERLEALADAAEARPSPDLRALDALHRVS
ncbi:MAG: hypothetical protein ACM35G_04145, partial [Planctomycetaceae bacterium]